MRIKINSFDLDATTSGLYVRFPGIGALDMTFWGKSSRWFFFRGNSAVNFHLGRLHGCMDRG